MTSKYKSKEKKRNHHVKMEAWALGTLCARLLEESAFKCSGFQRWFYSPCALLAILMALFVLKPLSLHVLRELT